MKAMVWLGKGLAVLFWLCLLGALLGALAKPFDQILSLLALLLISIHAVQLWLFSGALGERRNPWLDRLQVLAFGVFHLLAMGTLVRLDARRNSVQQADAEAAHA